MLTLYQLY